MSGGRVTAGQVSVVGVSILGDESAVFGLPFRLSVGALLFAALLVLSSISLSGFLEDEKERETVAEVSKLTVAAEQLSLRGAGSEVTLELRVPEDAKVGFGALPGREGEWPADAHNYYLSMGGREGFYASSASFSGPAIKGPAILGSGRHRLVLETAIEPETGRLFVLVSGNESEGLQRADEEVDEENVEEVGWV